MQPPIRVDFYLLADQAPSAFWLLACRLLTKAYRQNHNVFVYCKEANEACQLDELLWTYDPNSFIPHCIMGSESSDYSPIHIGWEEEKNTFEENPSLDFEKTNPFEKDLKTSLKIHDEFDSNKLFLNHKSKILFNLSSKIPSFYSQFQRVVELIANDEQAKAESRKRYANYRAEQRELYFHQV